MSTEVWSSGDEHRLEMRIGSIKMAFTALRMKDRGRGDSSVVECLLSHAGGSGFDFIG